MTLQQVKRTLAVGVTMSAGLAMAGDEGDWNRVRSLHPGTRIGVIRTNQQRIEGRFMGAADTEVVLGDVGANGEQQTVAKDDVVRVYKRPKVRRLVRTLIGAGIGVAAGGVLDATLGTRVRNEVADQFDTAQRVAAYAGGAAIGGAIAGLTGGGYETLYRRTTPVPSSTKK
jgi:hypothetical protein